jgi:hypothetical protein
VTRMHDCRDDFSRTGATLPNRTVQASTIAAKKGLDGAMM